MMTLSSFQAAPVTSGSPPPVPVAPDDRSTTFQPVENGGEQRSGSALMVTAYSVIWTLLMVWLVMLWRKQARLNERLAELEGAIAQAARGAARPEGQAASGGKAGASADELRGQVSS